MSSPFPFSMSRLAKPVLKGALPFIAQPLYNARDNCIFGYEALYSGSRSVPWVTVDECMVRYLASTHVDVPLFINLSNETICTIDEELIFEAHRLNNVFYEWSEMMSDDRAHETVVKKLNAWAYKGLRIVIDDFGAGRDGLQRIFSVEHITAIKIDGDLFQRSETNRFAKSILDSLVRLCDDQKILTVAECVETQQQFLLAQNIGVDFIQGYYIDDMCHAHLDNKYAA